MYEDCLDRIVDVLDALSDIPVTRETDAWFIGHTRNAAVLERRNGRTRARCPGDHAHRPHGCVDQPPTRRHDGLARIVR
jgi:hypothetical protein